MPLNPNIPLASQSLDVGNTLLNVQQNQRQNELLGLAREREGRAQSAENRAQQQFTNQQFDEREQRRIESVVTGAVQLKPLLERGDPQQVANFLASRKRALMEAQEQGVPVDTRETDIAMQAFREGGVEALQPLVDEALQTGAQLGLLGGAGDTPAEVRTFQQMTSGLSPEEREQARKIALGLESRAGQSRVVDIGNVPHQIVSTATGPALIPLSDLEQEATGAATVAGAQTAAQEAAETEAIPERARVETQTEDFQQAPNRLRAADDVIFLVDEQLDPVFDRVMENANAWTVGFGSLVKPPGSPAADLEADLQTLGANAAFDRLQQMRDQSQTGGALGQVSERELDLLRSAVAAIQQSQSPSQFRENVQRLRTNYERIADVAKQARRMDQLKVRINALSNRPQTQETRQRIQELQNRMFSIEDELWNRLDDADGKDSEDVSSLSDEEILERLNAG